MCKGIDHKVHAVGRHSKYPSDNVQHGNTPLHLAAKGNQAEITQMIIEHVLRHNYHFPNPTEYFTQKNKSNETPL